MDRFSAGSSRQRNPLTPREAAEKTSVEGPAAGAGRTSGRLGAAPPDRDFRSAGAPGHSPRRERAPAPMAGASSVLAGDGGIEKLRALTDLLRRECRTHLPRATPLPPIPGLRAAPAAKAVPNRLAIHGDERWPGMRPPPRRGFPARMALLLGGALVVALCAGVVATGWLPATDISEARPPDGTRRVALASLPQGGLTSTEMGARTAANTAGGERRTTVHPGDNLTGTETEAGLPQAVSARERSTAPGATSTIPGSPSPHQVGPEAGPTALLDVRNAKPVVEAEGQPLAGSICYPSALAVTQDHPDAWPAWTLHAPGHDGIRCWHATTRAPVHDRRTDGLRKKHRVGTLDDPGSPAKQANSFPRSPDFPRE